MSKKSSHIFALNFMFFLITGVVQFIQTLNMRVKCSIIDNGVRIKKKKKKEDYISHYKINTKKFEWVFFFNFLTIVTFQSQN